MAGLEVFFSDFGVVDGGGLRHEPGAVHAYFRNGKFTNIVKQGKFAIPVFRRTLVGHIEVIAISTASHEVAVEVPDVMTSDGYLHPRVVVRLQVRLNDEQGYDRVAKLLTKEGRNAGASLSAGLGSVVQAQVKSAFKELSSDDLLRSALTAVVPISLTSLADGVVDVSQVTAIEWFRSAAFEQNLQTAAHFSTLELTHEVEEIETRHTVTLSRIVSDEEEINRQREHERVKELARLDAMKEIATGYFVSGRASTKDFKEVMGAFTAPPSSAGRELPVSDWKQPAASSSPGPIAAIESSAMTVENHSIATDIPTLQMDARLKRIWSGLGLPDLIVGCASSSSGSAIGAAFVLSDTPSRVISIDQLRMLESELMKSYKAEVARVLMLPLLGTRLNLIENYLAEATRHASTILDAPIAGKFIIDIDDDDVSVRVALSGERAADVRRVLSDPEACLLSPLATLLALDYAEAVLGV